MNITKVPSNMNVHNDYGGQFAGAKSKFPNLALGGGQPSSRMNLNRGKSPRVS